MNSLIYKKKIKQLNIFLKHFDSFSYDYLFFLCYYVVIEDLHSKNILDLLLKVYLKYNVNLSFFVNNISRNLTNYSSLLMSNNISNFNIDWNFLNKRFYFTNIIIDKILLRYKSKTLYLKKNIYKRKYKKKNIYIKKKQLFKYNNINLNEICLIFIYFFYQKIKPSCYLSILELLNSSKNIHNKRFLSIPHYKYDLYDLIYLNKLNHINHKNINLYYFHINYYFDAYNFVINVKRRYLFFWDNHLTHLLFLSNYLKKKDIYFCIRHLFLILWWQYYSSYHKLRLEEDWILFGLHQKEVLKFHIFFEDYLMSLEYGEDSYGFIPKEENEDEEYE